MASYVLMLIGVGFAVSLPATWVVRAVSNRLNAHDTEPVPGQVKEQRRRVPNTGGVAVFLGLVLPIAAGLVFANLLEGHSADKGGADYAWLPGAVREHIGGIQNQTRLGLLLLGSLTLLHVLGLVDDRRPMGPWVKLLIMAVPAVAVPALSDTRLLTLLDAHVGSPWLSIVVTALWFLVVTNAMNFMDNMDGLAGGVGVVAASCFLAATLMQGQWFVGACLALLIGSVLGFLVFNFPLRRPATIFMGDGGSLLLGFTLAFLTARTTYYNEFNPEGTQWHAVFMPLIVLAVPLYDFVSVTAIRLSQGRSPFVGDLNHLSHRIVRRGLSKRAAVTAICALAAVTGSNAVFLGEMSAVHALFAGVQTLLVLLVIALIEFAATPKGVG
ncbi:MAG TPA: MraY family glycosyltransferase [Phycisphaerales bacterium]|nr:MraY family glycosyltransferase [Phycisphaerales bacterium]